MKRESLCHYATRSEEEQREGNETSGERKGAKGNGEHGGRKEFATKGFVIPWASSAVRIRVICAESFPCDVAQRFFCHRFSHFTVRFLVLMTEVISFGRIAPPKSLKLMSLRPPPSLQFNLNHALLFMPKCVECCQT